MAMFEWAEPPNTWTASVGWTPRAPFFKYLMYCSSALQTPPSAVPKLTPMQSCGFFARIIDLRVLQRELGRYDSELRVAIEPLQSVRRKKLFRIPIANLAGTTHTENTRIEGCNAGNTASFR